MINKIELKEFIVNNLKEGHFLIEISVSHSNQIQIFIDSMTGLTISDCVEYSKLIEEQFDREVEDYELNVSSGGLDLPLTIPMQYQKYLTKEVEVLTNEGKKIIGVLLNYDDTSFTIETEVKELVEGKKRKVLVKKELCFNINENVKSVKPVFSFKK